MKKDDNIEDLFKQSFDNYEPEVRPKVWKNIRVGLKWGSLAFLINAFINKIGTTTIIAVVASVVAVGIGSYAYFSGNGNTNGTVVATSTTDSAVTAATQLPANDSSNGSEPLVNTVSVTSEPVANAANTPVASTVGKTATVVSGKIKTAEPLASIAASALSGTAPLIVALENSGKGKKNKWLFTDGKPESGLANPVHVFEMPGIYQVQLISKDIHENQEVDTITIEVTGNAPAAKEFTPNGDGVTDVFVLQSKNIASMNAKIYDAAGLVVYKSEGTDTKWDGKDLQGKDAPEATYFYVVQAQGVDGKKYDVKGAVKLKR